MKAFLTVILFFQFLTLTAGKPIEEIIELETGSGKLEGTLLLPKSKKKVPLAIIIAGSGPTDRNCNNIQMTNNAYKYLAEALAKQNIASFRYDKRGVGASANAAITEADLSFDQYVMDAQKWIQTLRQDERFSDIIVIGHSEGALIGALASKGSSVSKFISLAGAGKKALDILYDQFNEQPEPFKTEGQKILTELKAGKEIDSISPMLASVFRPSIQPYLKSWDKYDPKEVYNELKQPILVINGTTDIQVSVENAKRIAYEDGSNLKLIEGMNHILKNAPEERFSNIMTYSDPDLPINEDLTKVIVEFVRN